MGSATGRIHAADLTKSSRLNRFLGVLADMNWHGSLEIVQTAKVLAVNSIASECRANGMEIDCRCVGRGRFEYRIHPRQMSLIPE